MSDRWYEQDWNEELTIVALAFVAILSIFYSPTLGNEIPLSIGSGLIGYLKGKQSGVNK